MYSMKDTLIVGTLGRLCVMLLKVAKAKTDHDATLKAFLAAFRAGPERIGDRIMKVRGALIFGVQETIEDEA